MASGGGGSKSTQTQTVTPTMPSWMSGPMSQYFSQVSGLMNNPPGGYGNVSASPLQTMAFEGAGVLRKPNAGLNQGMGATRGLLEYDPGSVDWANPSFDASQGLDRYMNPFQRTVIDNTTQNLARVRDADITSNQASATMAGAYGGSRHGVADALSNREFYDSLGNVTGLLNAQNYNQALAARTGEVERNLGADMFNRNLGLEGARFRLGAADQIGRMGLLGSADQMARLGLLSQLGGEQRDIAQENDPTNARMRYMAQIASMMGFSPSYFVGQNSTGTNTQSSSPSWMSYLGPALQAGSLFVSDRRLKRDTAFLGEDEHGNRVWEFAYVWDASKRYRGVMADEVAPEAVVMHPSGFAMVDYAKLPGSPHVRA